MKNIWKRIEWSWINKKQIISLNVGGDTVKVLRETLTVLPHSKLTWKFSGKWEHLLQRDKNNKIFLDYDAE